MLTGCDSSFGGTAADYQQAYNAGVRWWGHYFGGKGAYRVWSNNERQTLYNSPIPYHLPIWVPEQSFTNSPFNEATLAVQTARVLGIKKVFAIDVEENSGYTLEWGQSFATVVKADGFTLDMYHGKDKEPPSNVASWIALWTGNPSDSLPIGSAQQYRGATNAFGLSVDFDAASESFPLEVNPNVKPTVFNANPSASVKGKERDMHIFKNSEGAAVLIVGEEPVGIPDGEDLLAMQASGIGVAQVSDAFYNQLNQALNRTHTA